MGGGGGGDLGRIPAIKPPKYFKNQLDVSVFFLLHDIVRHLSTQRVAVSTINTPE